MRRFQVPLLNVIKLKKDTRFLDLSCGTGELLRQLAQREPENKNLFGIDISPGMLQKAREKLPERVRLLKADVHELPFDDNSFEYVVSTEAFHHYHSQEKALQEMKRVAQKNGKIIIVDVNFFFSFIHRLFERFEPGCVKVNSRKEMRQLFENAGLAIQKQKRSFLFAVMTIGEKKE